VRKILRDSGVETCPTASQDRGHTAPVRLPHTRTHIFTRLQTSLCSRRFRFSLVRPKSIFSQRGSGPLPYSSRQAQSLIAPSPDIFNSTFAALRCKRLSVPTLLPKPICPSAPKTASRGSRNTSTESNPSRSGRPSLLLLRIDCSVQNGLSRRRRCQSAHVRLERFTLIHEPLQHTAE
jgi:hypothetical protein